MTDFCDAIDVINLAIDEADVHVVKKRRLLEIVEGAVGAFGDDVPEEVRAAYDAMTAVKAVVTKAIAADGEYQQRELEIDALENIKGIATIIDDGFGSLVHVPDNRGSIYTTELIESIRAGGGVPAEHPLAGKISAALALAIQKIERTECTLLMSFRTQLRKVSQADVTDHPFTECVMTAAIHGHHYTEGEAFFMTDEETVKIGETHRERAKTFAYDGMWHDCVDVLVPSWAYRVAGSE